MEDSSAMTIEFLRARLLSERSVSRTSKQRADELARKVVELEEQLKSVSLQRKKAERATTQVLAILKDHGIDDLSEAFDSSSDQETGQTTPGESNVGNDSTKEEESSVNSKVRVNDLEGFSGSEPDSSLFPGRSLSWKSAKDSPRSCDKKYTDSSTRRRNSFASYSSSPKHHRQGKSCRQIRRGEGQIRSSEKKNEHNMLHESMVATNAETTTFSDCASPIGREGSENKEDNDMERAQIENQRKLSNSKRYVGEDERDEDMERALEHQAELIGRYEAQEKAQREWEEKYTEHNVSTPDSCEPGSHSDVTEERDENKAPSTAYPALTIASQDQFQDQEQDQDHETKSDTEAKSEPETKSEPENISVSKEKTSETHPNTSSLQDQNCITKLDHQSPPPEFTFVNQENQLLASAKGKQPQAYSESYTGQPASVKASSTFIARSSQKEESSSETYALVPHATSSGLGSVLEALQQARESLKHQLNISEGGPGPGPGPIGKAIEPYVPVPKVAERYEIPASYAGLFRVPNDFFQASSSPTYHLDSRVATRPYMEMRPSVPQAYDRFIGSPVSTERQLFQPYADMGVTSSNIYTYPSYPSLRSFSDLTPRRPPSNERGTYGASRSAGVPPTDDFSFYDDHHVRTNMYR